MTPAGRLVACAADLVNRRGMALGYASCTGPESGRIRSIPSISGPNRVTRRHRPEESPGFRAVARKRR